MYRCRIGRRNSLTASATTSLYWAVSMCWFSWQIRFASRPVQSEWRMIKFDTAGRTVGSYVTAEVKSVMAFLHFSTTASGSSVISILLFASGSDFDIFLSGFRKLLSLLADSSIRKFECHHAISLQLVFKCYCYHKRRRLVSEIRDQICYWILLPDVVPAVYAATDLHLQEHEWLWIKRKVKYNV